MPNERLRALLLERGETPDKLAEAVSVDPKTVERWMTKGRTPYRAHRFAVAAFFGVDESYIWPDALGGIRSRRSPRARSWPCTLIGRRFRGTSGSTCSLRPNEEIGVLVYAGLFLSEDTRMQRIFKSKAGTGVRVRILLGDPGSQVVADRGEDEGVGDAMAAKIRNALALYRTLRAVEGVEFRFHRTVLYNSIYVADDQVLVNTHVYGTPAAQAPVWHLHKLAGGELTSLYLDSFERVWESATPAEGG